MNKSPLFGAHMAHNAALEPQEGWMQVHHYGNIEAEVAAAQTGAAVVDLPQVDVIVLEGDEARRWCNGMFTNNTKHLEPGQGNRHAMCDDRGRVYGLLDLYCDAPDRFTLVLDGVPAAWFAKHYRMYLILDDIEVEDQSEDTWVLSLQGPRADELMAGLGIELPPEPWSHVQVADGALAGVRVCRKDRTGLGGVDLLVPTERLVGVFATLIEAGAQPMGQQALDTLRILAGRARWPQDGNEKSLVHQLRVNEEVCNFQKGCYVGQEVINRIDVRGAVQKRLMGLELDGDAVVPAGAEVLLEDKVSGTISSHTQFGGRSLALGTLHKRTWAPGTRVKIVAAGCEADATVVDPPFSA